MLFFLPLSVSSSLFLRRYYGQADIEPLSERKSRTKALILRELAEQFHSDGKEPRF
jgi:hypothetical protein